jgi:hypothetical protein
LSDHPYGRYSPSIRADLLRFGGLCGSAASGEGGTVAGRQAVAGSAGNVACVSLMSTLARILIAIVVGPGVGAVVGQTLARAIGARGGLEAGVIARHEMTGLLAGVLFGALFAALAIRATVGFEGRLRRRIADPALLPLGARVVAGLLAGQRHAPAHVGAAIRWATIAVWLLALLLLLLSLGYRPRPVVVLEPSPEEPPVEGVETGSAEPVDDETWQRYVSEEEIHE